MAIDATQSTDLVRSLTRENLQAGPKGKVELKQLEKEDKQQGLHKGDEPFSLFGDDGLSFWDVLDVFNPLQHIPVVNGIYRDLTGDEIDPAMKLVGGGLFGGVVGLATSALDVAVDGLTGKDIGEHVVALATEDVGETPVHDAFAKADDPYLSQQDQTVATAQTLKNPDAAQAAAVAATNAALINAGQATNSDKSNPASLDSQTLGALPDWNAKGQSTAFSAGSVASLDAPKQTTRPADKVFPMPERRFSGSSQAAKSVAELRAESMDAPVNHSTLTSASQLSPEAMRAAGLTEDMVSEVMRRHGKSQSKSEDSVDNAAPQTANIGQSNSTGGLESAWMFSAMNQALDKYQSASMLKSQSPAGVQPILAK